MGLGQVEGTGSPRACISITIDKLLEEYRANICWVFTDRLTC
jgi:hypothetical protein